MPTCSSARAGCSPIATRQRNTCHRAEQSPTWTDLGGPRMAAAPAPTISRTNRVPATAPAPRQRGCTPSSAQQATASFLERTFGTLIATSPSRAGPAPASRTLRRERYRPSAPPRPWSCASVRRLRLRVAVRGRYVLVDERPRHPRQWPRLASVQAASGLQFNLSHSGELALIGTRRAGAIGVDIEAIRTSVDRDEIAKRMFSAREYEQYAALPAGERDTGFFAAGRARKRSSRRWARD